MGLKMSVSETLVSALETYVSKTLVVVFLADGVVVRGFDKGEGVPEAQVKVEVNALCSLFS